LDASRLRQEQAETDLVVAEVSGNSLTLEQALANRAGDQAEGTITITLDVGADGRVQRRTRRVSLLTKDRDGTTATEQREDVTEALDP
jgi:hypothetical protein